MNRKEFLEMVAIGALGTALIGKAPRTVQTQIGDLSRAQRIHLEQWFHDQIWERSRWMPAAHSKVEAGGQVYYAAPFLVNNKRLDWANQHLKYSMAMAALYGTPEMKDAGVPKYTGVIELLGHVPSQADDFWMMVTRHRSGFSPSAANYGEEIAQYGATALRAGFVTLNSKLAFSYPKFTNQETV